MSRIFFIIFYVPLFAVPTHIHLLVLITMLLCLLSGLVTPFATAIYGVLNHQTDGDDGKYD